MDYARGDMQKIIDTTIALDVGFTALIQAIKRHDAILAATLNEELLEGVRFLPANLPGVEPILNGWRELLTTPTSDQADPG